MLFISTILQLQNGTGPPGAIFNFPTTPRKTYISSSIEIAGIKKGLVERCGVARTCFRGRLLFLSAGGRGGQGSARHRHRCRVWNGAHRTGVFPACPRPKFGIHPVGGTFLDRTRGDRKGRGERADTGDHRGRSNCPTIEASTGGLAGRDATRRTLA